MFARKIHIRISVLIALLLLVSTIFILWQFSSSGDGPTSCTAAAASAGSNSSQPPLYLGLDAYRNLDKLSYLELGDRVSGQSTADPGGSNFDSSHNLRVLPGGKYVLFDQLGPAMVTFMRMQENYGGPWKLTLDGNAGTTIGPGDLGQMHPTNMPAQAFPYPLSLNQQESQGSSIIASAIPFQKSMQWTSSRQNGNFYALYRKLPYGTPLSTWDGSAPASDVVNLLRCAGSDIAPGSGVARQSGSVNLVGGSETPVTTLSGPGQIRALSFHVPLGEQVRFGNTRLRIYWDGASEPAVDAPIKFLVGDGAGVYQPAGRPLVQGLLAGAKGDGKTGLDYNLYWPMPFASSARLVLSSDNTLKDITWSVRYEPFSDPRNWWGTFHATYKSIPQPVPGQDMTFLDVKGSGKLVGTVINFTKPGPTLEGDPHIYLDDNQTAQVSVTGTEEWGLGGNYWNGGNQTSLALGGLPSSVNNPPGANHDGAALYRFLVADSIPFNRHLIVRWEHGGVDQSTLPYRSVVMWYGTPAQTAKLSDTVSPASDNSRLSHAYQAPGEQMYQLSAAYEYLVHNPLITMDGSSTSTDASFTMALDPTNVGAFLRRTFDYCIPNQRANIYVDGHFAGTWYSAGSSNSIDIDGQRRCWRDEEFPLPSTLTQGKASVSIRVQFVPTSDPQNSAWTAFRYQVYSFVLPSSSPSASAPGNFLIGHAPSSQAIALEMVFIGGLVPVTLRQRRSNMVCCQTRYILIHCYVAYSTRARST